MRQPFPLAPFPKSTVTTMYTAVVGIKLLEIQKQGCLVLLLTPSCQIIYLGTLPTLEYSPSPILCLSNAAEIWLLHRRNHSTVPTP